MRFRVEQAIGAPVAAVTAAVVDAAYYDQAGPTSTLSAPEVVLDRRRGDVVDLHLRYGYTADLGGPARRLLDPAKLTWVMRQEVVVTAGTVTFVLVPDHYPDRLTCSGHGRFTARGEATVQTVDGDLRVHVPLVGGSAERAMVGGLRRHLADEAARLADWARRAT